MTGKSSTIFWKDGDGRCHWCQRRATSITEGHDGMCPVPYAAQLEERLDTGEKNWLEQNKQLSETQIREDKFEAENEALTSYKKEVEEIADCMYQFTLRRLSDDAPSETPISDVPITP